MLEKRYPFDFMEMLTHAEKYANVEEAYELHGALTEGKFREEKKADNAKPQPREDQKRGRPKS